MCCNSLDEQTILLSLFGNRALYLISICVYIAHIQSCVVSSGYQRQRYRRDSWLYAVVQMGISPAFGHEDLRQLNIYQIAVAIN